MPLDEDTPTKPSLTTREQFTNIVRRKLGEKGYSGDNLEAKLQELLARVGWEKASSSG